MRPQHERPGLRGTSHWRRLHVPAAGHRQILHQVRMGEMPKDDVRVGALSLAQRMEGGFNVGVGLLQLLGVAMGGRQPSAPGQWQAKPLNCVGSSTVADGGEPAGRQIDVGHGKRG